MDSARDRPGLGLKGTCDQRKAKRTVINMIREKQEGQLSGGGSSGVVSTLFV